MNISGEKALLRRGALIARANLVSSPADAAQAIAGNFLKAIALPPNSVVAGYVAARGEADPLPLMKALRMQGHRLALMRVAGKALPLECHYWSEGDHPAQGAYGLLEASSDWPLASPDVVLVPLLGFDCEGYRLGYGGGFYDRTLQRLRARGSVIAAGIAFSGQEMILPHDENDEALDWVVTEHDARKFERN